MPAQKLIFCLVLVSLVVLACTPASRHIREFQSYEPYIAYIRDGPTGPLVYYHPEWCVQLGEACGFFEAKRMPTMSYLIR